jgi:YjbE family integral membrane protein
MNFIELAQAPSFWTGLMTIIWVNIILSGDNAVMIALAARSLPAHQQRKAIFWGASTAVILRIVLTWFAVTLLQLPSLKFIAGLLLLWIAIKLLLPNTNEKHITLHDSFFHVISTILIADLIMSVDNIIAVAAAANGNTFLLALGLLLSIPLVMFGASMLITLMERHPIIITIGAAMIGWVAGAMVVTDQIIAQWIATNNYWPHAAEILPLGAELWGHIIGAITVLIIGKWLAIKIEKSHAE